MKWFKYKSNTADLEKRVKELESAIAQITTSYSHRDTPLNSDLKPKYTIKYNLKPPILRWKGELYDISVLIYYILEYLNVTLERTPAIEEKIKLVKKPTRRRRKK